MFDQVKIVRYDWKLVSGYALCLYLPTIIATIRLHQLLPEHLTPKPRFLTELTKNPTTLLFTLLGLYHLHRESPLGLTVLTLLIAPIYNSPTIWLSSVFLTIHLIYSYSYLPNPINDEPDTRA